MIKRLELCGGCDRYGLLDWLGRCPSCIRIAIFRRDFWPWLAARDAGKKG